MASSTPPSLPPTMRAWTYSNPGTHRQVLSLNTIPTPKPPTGDQVLVRVAYSGLNPGDLKIMSFLPRYLRSKNSVPAQDYSGTVVALGPTAPSNLSVGMKVFGMFDVPAFMRGNGTLSEYICISSSSDVVTPLPENVALEGAAGMACAGMMAFLSCKLGGIKEGNGYRVLVNGASGGCGSLFVQIVLGMGAKEVVATCSGPNQDLVRSLGAAKTIDYRKSAPLHEYLEKQFGKDGEERKFDFVLDTVGNQELYVNSPKFLKEGGVVLNIGDYTHGLLKTVWFWLLNTWWPTWLGGVPRRYVMLRGKKDDESTQMTARFMQEGKLRPVVDRCVDFEDVLEAFDVVATRRVRGRVIVKVGGD